MRRLRNKALDYPLCEEETRNQLAQEAISLRTKAVYFTESFDNFALSLYNNHNPLAEMSDSG